MRFLGVSVKDLLRCRPPAVLGTSAPRHAAFLPVFSTVCNSVLMDQLAITWAVPVRPRALRGLWTLIPRGGGTYPYKQQSFPAIPNDANEAGLVIWECRCRQQDGRGGRV